ncbi:MAG: hypothetical protein ACREOZ_00700 [Gloeomargaritales cyanobacterium]
MPVRFVKGIAGRSGRPNHQMNQSTGARRQRCFCLSFLPAAESSLLHTTAKPNDGFPKIGDVMASNNYLKLTCH